MSKLAMPVLLALSLVSMPACVESPDDVVELTDGDEPDDADDDALDAEEYDGPMEVIVVEEPPPGVTARLSDCPVGWFCLWEHANYAGRRVQFRGRGCQNLGPYGFNDRASSWANRSPNAYRVFEDAHCNGRNDLFRSGSRSSHLTGFWNDRMSSIRR